MPLKLFLEANGIIHRVSCPYTPEQNGTAERKHRHVVETGLTLMAHASMPSTYWDEAFQTAVFLINRLPSQKTKNKSPFQILFHRSPDHTILKTFGCLCYPFFQPYTKCKLQYRSAKCVFMGYSSSHQDTDVLICELAASLYLGMSFFMSAISLLLHI